MGQYKTKHAEELSKLFKMDDAAERAQFVSELSEKLAEEEAELKTEKELNIRLKEKFEEKQNDFDRLQEQFTQKYLSSSVTAAYKEQKKKESYGGLTQEDVNELMKKGK